MEIESQVILPRELDDLSSFIQEKPESLATATAELRAIALRATKFIFDLGEQIKPNSISAHDAAGLSSS
jgi:U3 small nucleolar RNA-associated protein MPP10